MVIRVSGDYLPGNSSVCHKIIYFYVNTLKIHQFLLACPVLRVYGLTAVGKRAPVNAALAGARDKVIA